MCFLFSSMQSMNSGEHNTSKISCIQRDYKTGELKSVYMQNIV